MDTKNDQFLSQIETYLFERGMSATAFGRESANDPNLVFDLREGRELRRATRDKITSFLSQDTAA